MALLTLSGAASSALAQVTANNFAPSQAAGNSTRHTTSTVAAVSSPKVEAKPHWKDLTPAQQLSLKPLAGNWSSLSEGRKRKWLALSKNYPSMSPEEQVKLHSRMTEWVSLSQQQRERARLNFVKTKQLTPAQKTATWEAYQALSPEEKQKLAAKAPKQPSGAAKAIKPTPPEKLAVMPVSRQTAKHPPKLAGSTDNLDLHTLLPQQGQDSDPAAVQKH